MKLKDEADAFIAKFGLGGLGELKEILSLEVHGAAGRPVEQSQDMQHGAFSSS